MNQNFSLLVIVIVTYFYEYYFWSKFFGINETIYNLIVLTIFIEWH